MPLNAKRQARGRQRLRTTDIRAAADTALPVSHERRRAPAGPVWVFESGWSG